MFNDCRLVGKAQRKEEVLAERDMQECTSHLMLVDRKYGHPLLHRLPVYLWDTYVGHKSAVIRTLIDFLRPALLRLKIRPPTLPLISQGLLCRNFATWNQLTPEYRLWELTYPVYTYMIIMFYAMNCQNAIIRNNRNIYILIKCTLYTIHIISTVYAINFQNALVWFRSYLNSARLVL